MESIKVKDYMNKRPVTFSASMPLSRALEKMLSANQTGGPVVDERNKVVGFLSEQDLIHKLLKAGYYCQDSNNVADCMHSDVKSVLPDDSIIRLAEEMLPAKPKVYPVIDEDERLVGCISRRDILRAISTQIDDCFHHPV
ncbi:MULTISPECIES: CBS domain-containing protein [Grimontia]|uniref:Choline transport ATP-binding protein OpuBA n=1 Tax=Grimontia marina TaxID=646534 RepID=A0A128FG78_9GAMM|nr:MULTISPECIES: CBS domain-containing protein [Grimontia]WRV97906.1 CBS domain-containing protein [Grimontia sp. NTOU-MAR1]CZF85803.1 Choline transport ATP-binding protein OpuBA [Grimontia marina]